MKGPSIRTVYQYTCVGCAKEESIRFPYNPMQPTPGLIESTPEGWSLIHFGDNMQTPVAMCNPCSEPDKNDVRLN